MTKQALLDAGIVLAERFCRENRITMPRVEVTPRTQDDDGAVRQIAVIRRRVGEVGS